MLQSEFEQRVGMPVTPEEYAHIEAVYMAADANIDKDAFCRMWSFLNGQRIRDYKTRQLEQERRAHVLDRVYGVYAVLKNIEWDASTDSVPGLSKRDLALLERLDLCCKHVGFTRVKIRRYIAANRF